MNCLESIEFKSDADKAFKSKRRQTNSINDELEDKENELSNKLQKLCDMHKKETDAQASTLLLHELGRIYHERSKNTKCFAENPTQTIVNLIGSAALYNAAEVRTLRIEN